MPIYCFLYFSKTEFKFNTKNAYDMINDNLEISHSLDEKIASLLYA
jgi:hypothetical protein